MEMAARLVRWFKEHPAVCQWGIVLILLGAYELAYSALISSVRTPAGLLIMIPVLVAIWLIGEYAWVIFLAGLGLQIVISLGKGITFNELLFERGGIYGAILVLLIMIVLINLRKVTRDLKQRSSGQQVLLAELHDQAAFLALLGEIISAALEAVDLTSILQVLVNRTGYLFGAHDCYITFWDEEKRLTLPQVAYGPLSEIYQHVHQFQDNEYTLTAAVMDAGHTIAIENVKDTRILSRNVAEEFPNMAALGLPLLAGQRKLGTLILGFNEPRSFSAEEIARAELAARQISLAITKAILLDEERRRTRQLDTLFGLAIESTQAKSEEELIGRATRLIGEKLYPRNFGIMLLDEAAGMLRVHPSYHTPDVVSPDIPVGKGITGRVAETGHPCRVDDVSQSVEYIPVDPNVRSELCVPLKLEDRLIGVVNVESIELRAFTPDDENLLMIMAGQLATAMGRLRAADESRQQAARLARANTLIRILAQVGTRASAAADPDRVLQTLGTELGRLDLHCLVSLMSADGEEFTIRYTSIAPRFIELAERFAHQKLHEYRIPREDVEAIIPAGNGPILIKQPAQVISKFLKGLPLGLTRRIFTPRGPELPVCIMPLKTESGLLGHLLLWGEGLEESDLPTMSIFASQIASALQNASLLVRVQRLAITDELTGLHNRRYFFEIATKEFGRAVHGKHPLSILIIDLDDFKQVNDKHGHLVGDQVLRGVAGLMQSCVRSRDVLGRYGGEEFSVVLPGAGVEEAVAIAGRFLSNVANVAIPTHAGDLRVHLSIGIASLQADVHSLTELVNRADQSMYQAKARGGDQYVVSP